MMPGNDDPRLIQPGNTPAKPELNHSSAYLEELVHRLETAHDFATAHLLEVKDVLAKIRAEII